MSSEKDMNNDYPTSSANITSRKKQRRRRNDDDDSEEDAFLSPSTSKRRAKNSSLQGTTSTARKNLNFDGLPNGTGKEKVVSPQTGQTDEDVIYRLLQAHMKHKNLITTHNCFEKQTVLDVMNMDIVRQESMQDMAVILNSAVEIYGYRVDRCHLYALDAKGNISASFNHKSNNISSNDGTKETPKKRRRDEPKQNLGDWKARLDEEAEHVLEDDVEDNEERKHILEEDRETFLDDIPGKKEDLDTFLKDLMIQRKEIHHNIHSNNSHLIHDNDELIDRTEKELSSNEYYQKAVSRYGEGNSTALLMYNAKVTSDAQAYLVHSRLLTESSQYDDELSLNYMKNVKDTLTNSLLANSKALDYSLLSNIEEILHDSDIESEGDNETGAVIDLTTANDHAENEIPIDSSVIPTNKLGIPVQLTKTKDIRKSVLFRSKNMSIERITLKDDFELDYGVDPYSFYDNQDFAKIQALRIQNSIPFEKKVDPEVELPNADLKDRSRYMEAGGIDEDVRELDFLWNSKVVQRQVDVQDTEEMITKVEASGRGEQEMIAMKRRILPPGHYTFFMSGAKENLGIPIDPYPELSTFDALDISSGEIFYDAEDNDQVDDHPFDDVDDFPVDDGETQAIEDVRMAMDKSQRRSNGKQMIPTEDVADVPINPGMILEAPDTGITNIGKEDDAHWKGAVQEEKDIRKKKTRTEDGRERSCDDFWIASNAQMRNESLERFTCRIGNIHKSEGLIYYNKPVEVKPFTDFEFEDFFNLSVMESKKAHPSYILEHDANDVIEKYSSLQDARLLDDEGNDILGGEFVKALHGYSLAVTENASHLIDTDNLKEVSIEHLWRSTDEWQNIHVKYEIDDEAVDSPDERVESPDERVGSPEERVETPEQSSPPPELNACDDDNHSILDNCDLELNLDNGDSDSYHSASDGINSPDSIPGSSVPFSIYQKSKLQEIRDLQAAQDIEDEEEIAEAMEGKAPIIIKNTAIDQSKVKSYLKNILTNKMLDKKSLCTVTEAANDKDYLDQTINAVKEMTLLNPGLDFTTIDRSFEFKDTGIDPLEVSRFIFSPPENLSQPGTSKNQQNISSQASLQNAVVLSDFEIQGEHSLASMMACLPYRAERSHEKNMHVALLFSIALQMCNENTLHCMQDKRKDEKEWLKDFVLKNGNLTQNPLASRQHTQGARIPEVIPEEDEDIDSETLNNV